MSLDGRLTLGIIVWVFMVSSQLFAQGAHSGVSKKALEYRLQGYEFQQQGDLDKAISLYRKSAKEDGSYATPHNDLGILYEQKGMYDAAERSYLRVLKIDQGYKGAYSNLAFLYENKGDLDKAIFYWKKRLNLEDNPQSHWASKAKERLSQLEQRRGLQSFLTAEEKRQMDSPRYEKKKKAQFKGWVRDDAAKPVSEDLGGKYFEQGLQYYNKKQFEKALGAFKLARTYEPDMPNVAQYMVKTQRILQAMEENAISEDDEYGDVLSREDISLAKDHFKIGLEAFVRGDYQRAFSSFTLAMTYNPYDETIQSYVADSRVKIEEAKIKRKQLKEDAKRKMAAEIREPTDIRRQMVKDKEDLMNKGYVTTTEDLSVEGFMNDGHELYLRERYEDAVYVWRQAKLLDVAGIYQEELESLINQGLSASASKQNKRYDQLSGAIEDQQLAEITKAAIPSEQGAPSWSHAPKSQPQEFKEEMSEDRKKIMEKLNVRYTLSFKDAKLPGVVDLLTELTGLNIIIDTREISTEDLASGNISFKVSNMPLIEIIEAVLRFTDYDYLIEDNLIWITTKDKIRTEDMVLVVYDVQDILNKAYDFPAEPLGSDRRSGSDVRDIG